jgi:hypothetical protein
LQEEHNEQYDLKDFYFALALIDQPRSDEVIKSDSFRLHVKKVFQNLVLIISHAIAEIYCELLMCRQKFTRNNRGLFNNLHYPPILIVLKKLQEQHHNSNISLIVFAIMHVIACV